MVKYYFLNEKGEILKFKSLLEAGKYFKSRGIKLNQNNLKDFWVFINKLKPLKPFSKEEADFLNKYNLNHSVFNVGCFQYLKAVYLHEKQFKKIKLKGGLKWRN